MTNTIKTKNDNEPEVIKKYSNPLENLVETEGVSNLKARIEILDKNIFEVIDNLVSRHELHAMHFGDQLFAHPYDTIKKVASQSKYRKSNFLKENEVNPHEECYMELKLSKKEYNFMTNVVNRGMTRIKKQYKDGIELLLKARDIFVECLFNHFSTKTSIVRSDSVDIEKILSSKMHSLFKLSELIPVAEIWGIEKSSKTLSWDILPISEINKFACKKLDELDPRFKMEIDTYKITL